MVSTQPRIGPKMDAATPTISVFRVLGFMEYDSTVGWVFRASEKSHLLWGENRFVRKTFGAA